MKTASYIVLDCSVTMTWCFTEETTKNTIAVRDSLLQSNCYVPSIWSLEVNNVLWMAIKNKKISDLQAARFKYLLKALPIQVDYQASDLMNDVIFELSKKFNIPCYDAAYLELALREKLALATLDKTLNKAAKAAGITLLC